MIISKIALIFDQQSSLDQFFRWYNILELEKKLITENNDNLRWRSNFV